MHRNTLYEMVLHFRFEAATLNVSTLGRLHNLLANGKLPCNVDLRASAEDAATAGMAPRSQIHFCPST
jgi:hypothetical protein